MALCKTDLAILRNDPVHDRNISAAWAKTDEAVAKIRQKYTPKLEALEAAYEAAKLALAEKRNTEIEKEQQKFHGRQSAIRERSIKRLKLRHFDALDDEGLAQ